jgi:hypothetical protein
MLFVENFMHRQQLDEPPGALLDAAHFCSASRVKLNATKNPRCPGLCFPLALGPHHRRFFFRGVFPRSFRGPFILLRPLAGFAVGRAATAGRFSRSARSFIRPLVALFTRRSSSEINGMRRVQRF